MPRPAQYNLDDVTERALRLFWRKGYGATSMKDLEQVLDMRPGSIYAAFGSKSGLFEASLNRYLRDMVAGVLALSDSGESPLQALCQLLRDLARACAQAGEPGQWPVPSCMAIKVMLELDDQDAALMRRLHQAFADVERNLATLVAMGQEQGEIRNDLDPERLARVIQSQIMGVRVFAHRDVPATALQDLGEDLATGLHGLLAARH